MEVREFLKKVVNFAFVMWVNRPDIVGICKTGVSSGAILNPVRLVQGVHRTIEGDRRGSLRDCVDSLAELDCLGLADSHHVLDPRDGGLGRHLYL